MTALQALIRARALLEGVTPLKRDCGRLCAAACCRPDEDGRGGMLLFPGEEALYAGVPGFEITPCGDIPGGRLITCAGPCDRALRPLSCRLFPLWPGADGAVRADRRALAVCPLARMDLSAFDPAFITSVRKAADILITIPDHRTFLGDVEASIIKGLMETGLWEA